jgi:hypothetical protein
MAALFTSPSRGGNGFSELGGASDQLKSPTGLPRVIKGKLLQFIFVDLFLRVFLLRMIVTTS